MAKSKGRSSAPAKRAGWKELKEQIRQNKPAFVVWSVLRVIVILVAVWCVLRRQWESFLSCLLTLLLFMAPSFVEKKLQIKLPTALEISVLVFIFCAQILGEIACFYIQYPFWDKMLHTANGFLFAAFGFCLVDLLNENKRFRFALSPMFQAVMAFCFSMTIGVAWEFFEFGADHLLGLDMQKDRVITEFQSVTLDPTESNIPIPVHEIEKTTIETADGSIYVIDGYLDVGLVDTTEDLFVNFIGAVVFCVVGWIYISRRGKNRLAAAFIPVVTKPETSAGEHQP
ncbi:MAG: hypothetical protein E7503_06905 [Ruminococcus sp.]|nr:hypothetical protein [Ruminococcus sp.]